MFRPYFSWEKRLQTNSKPVSVIEGEEQQHKMLCGGSGDEKLREKMVEAGDGDSWTLDCLRKRLLAERVNSRVAKEDSEIMGKKLIELESQIKQEIRARNRAEKMLKLATKKLESLKKLAELGQSCSQASEGSGSSSACSSSLLEPDERSSPQKEMGKCNTEEKIKMAANSSVAKDFRTKNSATAAYNAVNQVPHCEQSSSLDNAASSQNSEDGSEKDVGEFKDSMSSTESTTDALRRSSAVGEEIEEKQDDAENALAIVPVNMWPESRDSESQTNCNIHDVLLALRHAKEHLQNSIGIRSSTHSQSFGLCGM